jgi:hypothetical protein
LRTAFFLADFFFDVVFPDLDPAGPVADTPLPESVPDFDFTAAELAEDRASRRETQPSMFLCRSRATARASSGTFLVIVEPAATKALGSISTGETRFTLQPMNAPSPIVVRVF